MTSHEVRAGQETIRQARRAGGIAPAWGVSPGRVSRRSFRSMRSVTTLCKPSRERKDMDHSGQHLHECQTVAQRVTPGATRPGTRDKDGVAQMILVALRRYRHGGKR